MRGWSTRPSKSDLPFTRKSPFGSFRSLLIPAERYRDRLAVTAEIHSLSAEQTVLSSMKESSMAMIMAIISAPNMGVPPGPV